MTLMEFRELLRRLDDTAMAALLHELGFELYRRDLYRWRALSELADDLMDRATFDARGQIVTRWTKRPAAPSRRPRKTVRPSR